MNTVEEIRQSIEVLVRETNSPVFVMSGKIVDYLTSNPQQRDLTIGGLRAALSLKQANDNVLIQAAFTLTSYPLELLSVRYRLFDESLSDVIQEFDHEAYAKALNERCFIDIEGNRLSFDELQPRVFPYFINQLSTDDYLLAQELKKCQG